MFNRIFAELKNNQELACLYCNKSKPENFLCGYVIDCDSNYVLINSITPEGEDDGFVVKKCESIFMLEYKNAYIAEFKNSSINTMHNIGFTKNGILPDTLNYAKESELFISIQINNSGYIDCQGFVDSITNGILTLRAVDNDSHIDGFTACRVDNITTVSFDGIEEKQIIKKLSNNFVADD